MKKIIHYIILLLPMICSALGTYLLFTYPYLDEQLAYLIVGVIFLVSAIILLLGILARHKHKKIFIIITIVLSLIVSGGIGYVDYIYMHMNDEVESMTDTVEYQYAYVYVLDDFDGDSLEDLDGCTVGLQSETDELCYQIPKEELDGLGIDYEIEIYANGTTASTDLLDGVVDAIVVDSSDLNKIDQLYSEFALETKCIGQFKQEVVSEDVTSSVDIEEEGFTVLINGVDSRSGNLDESSNADVIMLATFNPKTMKLSLISIPRDTYIPITCEGGVRDKITHSGSGGIQCTIDSLEQYLDIEINYYIKMNFDAVVELVDAIDGIDIDVPITFCEQDSNDVADAICLDEGYQHLDGEQALALARHRKTLANGDIGRGANQQLVIKGIIDKLASGKIITSVNEILSILGDNIQTNITAKEMRALFSLLTEIGSQSLYSNTSALEITSYTVQGEGAMMYASWANADIYYYIPYKESIEAIQEEIAKVLGTASYDPPTDFSFNANIEYDESDSTTMLEGYTLDID